jgi:hypothetical protein
MISGSGFCSSFKKQMFQGLHHLSSDQLFLALYTADAPLDLDATTAYITTDEVAGTGYTAGGQQLSGAELLGPVAYTAYLTFNDAIWPASTITARGGLIYNRSYQQAAIAILDFGSDRYSNAGNFRVKFPPPGPGTALMRLL